MSKRSRSLRFGGAGALVLAGAACAAAIGGGVGQIVALVLIGLGLVAAVSLIFYEVGLSEDRERAREEGAHAASQKIEPPARGRVARAPKLDRMRGRRRRLR